MKLVHARFLLVLRRPFSYFPAGHVVAEFYCESTAIAELRRHPFGSYMMIAVAT